jgi:predicted  nucleic acid-binding Zn-ribbon protein
MLKMAYDNDGGSEDEMKGVDQGEILAFMKDIERESRSMMDDLVQLDNRLASVQGKLERGKGDKKELAKEIEAIRVRIGALEREDKRELSEEEVAKSLLGKLKRWIDQVV